MTSRLRRPTAWYPPPAGTGWAAPDVEYPTGGCYPDGPAADRSALSSTAAGAGVGRTDHRARRLVGYLAALIIGIAIGGTSGARRS